MNLLNQKLKIFMIEKRENLISRAPIVVVLGHVDSGKTSILDAVRKTHVAEKETGGITQHVGAYEVELQGKKITFIDTPGHEAFSAMRARGAKVADIAILVVDGVAGVQDQTKEAITHIKKAGIPMIIAINKIDRPEADPEKIKRELAKENILVESIGGKVPSVEVSAKTGKRIGDLLELILLVAEIENLKGDISKPGEGVVIESYLDSHRGPTATLLLRDGILKPGEIVGTFSTFGKIKMLENFQGKKIEIAYPSMPVISIGFEDVPRVGERFKVFGTIEEAQNNIPKVEKEEKREVFLITPDKKVLNLILKTDVLGSIEPIENVLKGLPQEKVILRILKAEVGDINESDFKLAQSAKAKILGFRVKITPVAKSLAEREKIKILTFEIIYDFVQTIRGLMEKILEPEIVRTDLAKLKTLLIFWTEGSRQIVGAKVLEGEVKKGTKIEVIRGEEKVGQGKLINLQINKKDVEKAIRGQECGILYEGDAKIQEGDILVIFTKEKRKLGL
ncbi:MAG: translation initiation factor IF-2 [Candidatus Nealsonbacteria bacterium CG_4_10_14_0_8_um_filter_35_10]|uniref:Translation initiation factor IF-2 n=2 Tax=Candidatus Nealsoniibacteriota TaxID=1817911 RepID=A0A2M7R8M7_9BACT|nr:MAG: translation initiation factor IF-2 [Parcubacteria group bacterium CG1_02_36_42]PIY90952.1 MAG: translation initiation factor IF-2 [Candidatus Nealsonbacteria bacterium CG_4_10_14_0_8_um_filter_35_10]PJB99287.1 MAG: translation initiation factor IF-2 [Candidatus Nealsonbacteria bacterium CG_4_9_14_0_8_um_filter_35_12]